MHLGARDLSAESVLELIPAPLTRIPETKVDVGLLLLVHANHTVHGLDLVVKLVVTRGEGVLVRADAPVDVLRRVR